MTEQQAQQVSDQLESIRRMYHKECRLHAATKAELAEARKDGERLRTAAQAVVDRWDSINWKDAKHTGEYIAALRTAIGCPQ